MFLSNKYTKWYYQIVNNAISRSTVESYVENHHIIPKSLNGNNKVDNMVALTAREHFICHWLLTKMTVGKHKASMIYALMFMQRSNTTQERYSTKITSRVYENYKKIHSMIVSNAKLGKALTEETKLKMSRAKQGKVLTVETKLRMSDAKKGKPSNRAGTIVTEETRAKISAALTGKAKTEETKEKFRNRKQSEETKLKISLASKGRIRGKYKKKLEIDK